MYEDDEIKFNYNTRRFFTDIIEVHRLISEDKNIKEHQKEEDLEKKKQEHEVTKYGSTNIISLNDYNSKEELEEELEDEDLWEKDIVSLRYHVTVDYFKSKYKEEEEIYDYWEYFINMNIFIEKNRELLERMRLIKQELTRVKISRNLILFLLNELKGMGLPEETRIKLSDFKPNEMKRDSFCEYKCLGFYKKLF